MGKIRIMVVTGTRPEIIKVSVFIRLLQCNTEFQLIFVHSGQHYDDEMFHNFLEELELPPPDYDIHIGSFPNSVQTGKMLISLYDVVEKEKPDIILAQGDTNTVFAAALTALKCMIPFGHIEAGIRSYDMQMPEEANRMLSGVCSRLNFAPTMRAVYNLLDEGVSPQKIFLTGNSIVDAVQENLKLALKKSEIEKKLNILPNDKLITMTMHRPANVDNFKNLNDVIQTLLELITKYQIQIIFPVHPRTRIRLEEFKIISKIQAEPKFTLLQPIGYLDMLKLMNMSTLIMTDSGGLQEEAVLLKKPCITLRENTERPESIEVGGNILTGTDPQKIAFNVKRLLTDEKFYVSMIPKGNPFGNGDTSMQIIQIIQDKYKNNELKIASSAFFDHIPYTQLIESGFGKNETVKEFEEKHKCEVIDIFNEEGMHVFPQSSQLLKSGWKVKVRWNLKH